MPTEIKIETRNCKVPACPSEAEDRVGPYAGLCSRHKRQKVAERSESIRANLAKGRAAKTAQDVATTGTPAATTVRAPSAVDQTRELLRRATEIDKATAKVERAAAAHRDAIRERGLAIAAHRDLLRTMLGEHDQAQVAR